MKYKPKVNDLVVFTKKARKLIASVTDDKVHIIISVNKVYDTINVEFEDGSGCDAYWIKKVPRITNDLIIFIIFVVLYSLIVFVPFIVYLYNLLNYGYIMENYV